MISKEQLEGWHSEGQKDRRPIRKFFKKHAKKIRIASAKAKALENKKNPHE